MKILFVGEIVAETGRKVVKKVLPDLIKEIQPDFIFSNAENIAGGRGVTEEALRDMTQLGIDYFTSGDHVFHVRGTEDIIDRLPIIVPANYPVGTPGRGWQILDGGARGQVLLISLMGRTAFSSSFASLDDPFRKADQILSENSDKTFGAIVVDFHADATSEKAALGHYLDGRVTAVIGSHTHIPTCDNIALPKGTLFVTDVGMCGAIDSVLGVVTENVIAQYLTARHQRFEWETAGRQAFRSVLLDTVKKSIERIDKLI